MTDFTLNAESPLGGVRIDLDGISIREMADLALVSIAVPRGGEDALNQALKRSYKAELPIVGTSTLSPAKDVRFLGLQRDQVFLLTKHLSDSPVVTILENLGNAGYYSNQSDSWAVLELSGPKSRAALERICPIDLDPDEFHEGAVTRTQMEHLGVIILRIYADKFLLFSPTSSSRSFLRMVETSAHNVL